MRYVITVNQTMHVSGATCTDIALSTDIGNVFPVQDKDAGQIITRLRELFESQRVSPTIEAVPEKEFWAKTYKSETI